MALTDGLQADVLIQVEIEHLPYRPPVIASILLPFFPLTGSLSPLVGPKSSLTIPTVAGRRNRSVEPSGFLLGLDAAFHPGNDFFLLLGSGNAEQ